jgi:23S rRNA pseudouridine1911/1915/1917 synthase
MTTRLSGGRQAITHYRVVRRIDNALGKFTLLEVKIETGRTHQIRVHMASIGHPIVGDVTYGAPKQISSPAGAISLRRNFLHAAELELVHPRTEETISLKSELPEELSEFLRKLTGK